MFARLVLIVAILGFVYVRNIECCESETSTKFEEVRSIETMEHENAPPTEDQQPIYVKLLPRKVTTPVTSHAHVAATHPKKRAISDKRKEDPQQMDLRPGCCG
ncbi:uncharacterized protein LOC144468098 [Augochlora pura]